MSVLLEFTWLLLIDGLFLSVLFLLLYPLAKFRPVALAVLKRNFLGYFANPTGYVFLCLFVLLTSLASFWPHEFFASNLANLDQLNNYLPYIMLIFVPAITMSIWADERRQGTDELLLTLPANDFDIVIGKYFAAAAIFTASLMFSQIANYTVLILLSNGSLDTGLLMSTYFGYWMMGLSMLAIGMVASFLTSNLTVGFVLGVVFNAPLAFAKTADLIIPDRQIARALSRWSLAAQFDNFGRGVLSVSSIVFFTMVAVVGVYLAMVLIGRRHWLGGRDGRSMIVHFFFRAAALLAITVGVNIFFSNYDFRQDISEGQISSLSPDTRKLLAELDPEHTIYIDAFISEELPEMYVQTRYDLNSMLKEFASRARGKLVVNLRDGISTFSDEAERAETRFGIQPQQIASRSRGAIRQEDVILGAAFRCGMEKVVVPFFDYGIPVEYELLRSIATVAQNKRPKIGVVRTAASLNGGFNMAAGQMTPKEEFIVELEKQYTVEDVDLNTPPESGVYDVLLVAQPSTLPPQQLDVLITTIQSGQPILIFEDPRPQFLRVPSTGEPVMAGGGGPFGGMMGGGQPQPKGDIRKLWDVLGIRTSGRNGAMGFYTPDVVWQSYNPYPVIGEQIDDTWVFVSPDSPGGQASLNPLDPVTRGIKEVLMVAPGVVEKNSDSQLDIQPLLTTGSLAGRIPFQELNDARSLAEIKARQGKPENAPQFLAVRIQGDVAEPLMAAQEAGAEPKENVIDGVAKAESGPSAPTAKSINAIYVADVDCLFSAFFRLRARPDPNEDVLRFNFENVTFLLNCVDSLAGVDDYIEIRKRKPYHATLKLVEQRTEPIRDRERAQRQEFRDQLKKDEAQFQEELDAATKKYSDAYQDLLARQQKGETIDRNELLARKTAAETQQRVAQRRLAVKVERLRKDQEKETQDLRRRLDLQIERIQNEYKVAALVFPPIPPLIVGIAVYFRRRLLEREGVSQKRLA